MKYTPKNFKKGDYVKGYGTYLGITKVQDYNGKIHEEHRFRTDKTENDYDGFDNIPVIKEIRTDDEKTLKRIDDETKIKINRKNN